MDDPTEAHRRPAVAPEPEVVFHLPVQAGHEPSPPHMVFDPEWLARSHLRCLWDGGEKGAGRRFCSPSCRLAYEEWRERTARSIARRAWGPREL